MRFDRANASFGVAISSTARSAPRRVGERRSIRMRFKVDPPELTPALLEKLPPMPPELSNPPVILR